MTAYPTRADLRNQVRRIADIETDGNHITDTEINEDLNSSISALWAVLIGCTDGSLFARLAPNLSNIGDNAYQLPDDFLRLVSVDVYTNGVYIHSTPADPQRYAQLSQVRNKNFLFLQHYLQFNVEQGRYELFIFPAPEDTDNIFVRYVPAAPSLELDTSELKLPADWYRWAVYDTAIKCNIKEETDPMPVMSERERIELRIMEDVRAQSVSQVKTIRDVAAWENGGNFVPPDINFRGS